MMRLRRAMLLTLVVGIAGLLQAPRAQAGPTEAQRQQAGQHFQRGVGLYSDGDYRGALVEFGRAYKLAPTPQVLYNLGQTRIQLQDYAAALRSLEQYLATAGPDAEFRKMAEQALETVRGRVGKLEIAVSADGAEVSVDDEPAGVSPLSAAVVVSMGRRKIAASAGGRTATTVVEVGGGDLLKVRLELPAERAVSAGAGGASKGSGGARRGWAWATWAGFGAFGIASIACGALAIKASSELDQKRETFGTPRAELDSTATRSKNLALATDVLLAATAVTGGVALYLTLTLPKREKPAGEGAASRVKNARLELLPGGVRLKGSF